ncbi:MAG: leucyl aminopeptidase [Gammaproteobacteria bacterium]|nr:MAG: leucyl aminopeptidase [Gammaproteobacteria bacterium]
MHYFVTTTPASTQQSDCVIVAVFDQGQLSPSAKIINDQSNGYLEKVIARGDIEGKAGQTLLLQDVENITSPRVLLVGCGKQDKTTEKDFNSAISAITKVLNDSGADTASSYLSEINVKDRSATWKTRQTIITAESALYKYTATKSDVKAVNKPLTQLGFFDQDGDTQSATELGQAIATGMNLARELSNLPGNVCTPTYLANQAVELGQRFESVTTTILDEAEMETLGMSSLLSVSRGSREEAKLIVMNYQGAGDDRPVVLVGKGLTFDAGGISLKPASGMDEMKYDMCGSASVFGTISAIAELNLPINVVGVVPSSENMPDGDANKPGDIVTSMAGKTIEILNTDAEGRLILCDALTYSERFNPEVVIDIATLTGAVIVALGHQTTGLMANDQDLADALLKAGNDSHDRAWQLPIWDDYQPQLDSNFADIANIGGKGAGSITAACFLSRFTENFTWAHLDIAGTAWVSGKDKGATGRPVPLLVQFLLNHIETKK